MTLNVDRKDSGTLIAIHLIYLQWLGYHEIYSMNIIQHFFKKKTENVKENEKERQLFHDTAERLHLFFRKYNCLPSNARHQHTVHPHEIVQ